MAKKVSANSDQIRKAIEYIKANWRKGKTLKEIAALHNVDPGNLDRAFRQHERMTEKAFVDRMRAEYVKSRLSRDSVLGYELAAELGFASDFCFYRWVKRVFWVSFKELRRHTAYKE
jgi:methylphosphotriester-DNA--protein-cysteine methyltransferase